METTSAPNIQKKLPLKLPDIAIILLFAALTVFSGVTVYLQAAGGQPMVVIQGPNDRKWIYPLSAEETVRVAGVLGGDTVVRISGGEVWAESSPCDNQTCVAMGRINAVSMFPWVACLPNNVFFKVEGTDDVDIHVDGAAW